MTKTKFGLIAVITCAIGYHYYELKQELFVSKWKNEIHQCEHRILRDELSELRSKPTFEMGVIYSTLRSKSDSGFSDGMVTAFRSFQPEFNYEKMYHMVCESLSANQIVTEKLNRQKEIDAYHQGISDASESLDKASSNVSPVSDK